MSRLNHLCRYIRKYLMRRIVAMAFAAGIGTAALTACGYKGPLILPEFLPEPYRALTASPAA